MPIPTSRHPHLLHTSRRPISCTRVSIGRLHSFRARFLAHLDFCTLEIHRPSAPRRADMFGRQSGALTEPAPKRASASPRLSVERPFPSARFPVRLLPHHSGQAQREPPQQVLRSCRVATLRRLDRPRCRACGASHSKPLADRIERKRRCLGGPPSQGIPIWVHLPLQRSQKRSAFEKEAGSRLTSAVSLAGPGSADTGLAPLRPLPSAVGETVSLACRLPGQRLVRGRKAEFTLAMNDAGLLTCSREVVAAVCLFSTGSIL